MVESTKPKVCITGITGFLGSQVCRVFLEDGHYAVRGTVRDKDNKAKLAPLIKAFGEERFNQLELVNADLGNEESILQAV